MRCSVVRNVGFVALALVAGCSTAQHGSGWLEELRSREAQLPELRMIGSDDGSFAAEVPADMVGSVVAGDDADFVTLDIGGDSPIECALYHDEVESASTLQMAAEQVFSNLANSYEVGVKRQISKLDAGVVGPSPFLELHWQYWTDQQEGQVLGELKQMIANREGRSIYCVHHENGYSYSFHRVFQALVESIRFAEYDQLRPYYTQVEVLSEGDNRSGFSILTLTLDEDGDPRIVRYTTRLGKAAADRVSARDVTEVEHSTVGGVLRGKLFTDYRDGGINSSLFLEGGDDSGWRVSGQREGETLQTTFVEPRLASWLGEVRDYRRLIINDAKGRETASKVWSPDLKADAGTVRSVTLLDRVDDGHYAATVATGGVESRVVVDQQGVPKSSSQSVQNVTLSRERVFVEGSLQ